MLFLATLLWSASAFAGTLRVDLDRDGVRDIVWMAQAPARPGVEVWLSSTGRLMRFRLRRTALATDVDHNGWPDLFERATSPLAAAGRAWKTANAALRDLGRKHPSRKNHVTHRSGGRVRDTPEDPPSSVPRGTVHDVVTINQQPAFAVRLTPGDCAASAPAPATSASHRQPRSPRAPPTPQFA